MKKLILSLIGCMFAGACVAQTQSGSLYTGAHFGGGVKKENSFKTTTFSMTPTVGYFINSSWMIGVQASYQFSEMKDETVYPATPPAYVARYTTSGEVTNKAWSVGPVARYFVTLSPKFAFFAEGNAGIADTETKVKTESNTPLSPGTPGPVIGYPVGIIIGSTPAPVTLKENKQEEQSIYGNLAPGLVFFPAPKIGIELKVNMLNYTKRKDIGSELKADFSLANTSIGAGFYF